uniref:Uncharacterized protein n=1 Tax=Haptolina brevifila TaxID=156173 RepID=A0A7S2CXR8_9EUKA
MALPVMERVTSWSKAKSAGRPRNAPSSACHAGVSSHRASYFPVFFGPQCNGLWTWGPALAAFCSARFETSATWAAPAPASVAACPWLVADPMQVEAAAEAAVEAAAASEAVEGAAALLVEADAAAAGVPKMPGQHPLVSLLSLLLSL